jgi:aldehyde dehydrogenase (NAD+)
MQHSIADIFSSFGAPLQGGALTISAPASGEVIAKIKADSATSLAAKIAKAAASQKKFGTRTRREREALLKTLADAIKANRESLARVLSTESGKTLSEAFVEVDGSVNVIAKTIADATLAESGGMLRTKEREPVGNVGLITSFNFPMVVAFWTLAPALLAGNSVVWKPSEKTPLVALAVKAIFDKALGKDKDLLAIAIGGRDIGQALVAHKNINMVSATGSVGMGKAIEKTLAKKRGNVAPPILELGGNNGAIISDKISPEHLTWSLNALMNSFLGTTGQRCTNTRRLFVHKSLYEPAVAQLENILKNFMAGLVQHGKMNTDNVMGYNALIDADAFKRFEQAKKKTIEQGGKILLGNRILQKEFPHAYYVEPALALLPKQSKIMHEETFAPILFVVPYKNFDEAMKLVNAPANAGLVNAIYTQNQSEADRFAYANLAGHALINSAKGTGTPAHGMGFGGNKDSGSGEILNAADPLAAFTKRGRFTRIAQNKDVVMS